MDNTVRIWDVLAEKVEHILEGHSDMIFDVVFSPIDPHLASCDNDGTVRLWSLRTGNQLFVLYHSKPVYQVIYFPDGIRFVSVSIVDCDLRWWKPQSGERIEHPEMSDAYVSHCSFYQTENVSLL